MTPLRILHINNYAGESGADLAFRTTVEILREHSDLVTWTAYVSDTGADLTFDSWESRKGIGKLNYIYSSANRARLASFLDEHRPDVVHAHGFYSAISPSILGAIQEGRRGWNMKFVHTAHSHELICSNASAFDYTQNRICMDCKGRHPKLKIFYRNCDRRGWIYSWVKGVRCLVARVSLGQVEMTDMIICPSELMMNNLRDEGIEDARLTLIRNPMQMHRYPPSADRDAEIVYFGRFSIEKDVASVIDAFGRFRDRHAGWKLILIGDGPERERLKEATANAGLNDAVEFLPFLDQTDLFARLSRSRVMAMTSTVLENWPLVIPEAVMCGLYPVVPDHGGMKEAVDWLGVGNSYRAGDLCSLADALDAATANNTASINAAQDRIENELGPQWYTEKISRIYRQLVES